MSRAITTEGQVIDVSTAAGLSKPDISILSDQFLAEVRGLKHKNVAAELLEKLLKDELKVRSKHNLVQSQLFSEKLKKTLFLRGEAWIELWAATSALNIGVRGPSDPRET